MVWLPTITHCSSSLQRLYALLHAARSSQVQEGLAVHHVAFVLQCDDQAYDQNEQMMERLLAIDDIDAVQTNCAGLA